MANKKNVSELIILDFEMVLSLKVEIMGIPENELGEKKSQSR